MLMLPSSLISADQRVRSVRTICVNRAAPPGEYRIASDPPDYLVLREEVERAARREPHG